VGEIRGGVGRLRQGAWVRRQMKEPEPRRGRGGGIRGEEAVEGDEGRGVRGGAGMKTAAE